MIEALERDEHTATYAEGDDRRRSAGATDSDADDDDTTSSARASSTTGSAAERSADTDRSGVERGTDPLVDDAGSSDAAVDRD